MKLICNLLNEKVSFNRNFIDQIIFVADRPGHDLRYAIDNSFIVKELGWQPKYPFEEGLNKTVDWYLANQKWFENILNKNDFISERIGLNINFKKN